MSSYNYLNLIQKKSIILRYENSHRSLGARGDEFLVREIKAVEAISNFYAPSEAPVWIQPVCAKNKNLPTLFEQLPLFGLSAI